MSIREHTKRSGAKLRLGYSIREHTSAYVGIREHAPAYLSGVSKAKRRKAAARVQQL